MAQTTDGSGERIVIFTNAKCELISGEPLPEWAQAWLDGKAIDSDARGRAALQAALDDADWHEASRDGW